MIRGAWAKAESPREVRRRSGTEKPSWPGHRGSSPDRRVRTRRPKAARYAPQGEFERLGQAQDHVPAWSGPAGLDKAEMPLGRARPHSEIGLAEMTPGAASAQR